MREPLPIGVWFEEKKDRFRVRLYRNGCIYRNGYHKSKDAALQAYGELLEKVKHIPRLKRGEKARDFVPPATFAGLMMTRHT